MLNVRAAAVFLLAVVPGVSAQPVPSLRAFAQAAARATAPPAQGRLTLDACVAAAVSNNARPRAAAEGATVASARHGQALSSRYPQISASVSATRLDEAPNFAFPGMAMQIPAMTMQTPTMALTLPPNVFGPGFPPAAVQIPVPGQNISIPAQMFAVPEQNVRLMDTTVYAGSLHALYAVYTGGLASARIAQARAGMDAAGHEQRQAAAELVYDVRRAYWGVVLASRLRATASDTYERMSVTLELTQRLYETGSGRVKKTDFLRHGAMVHSLASMLAEFDAQERTARAALAMLVGWDRPEDIQVADEDFADADGAVDVARLVVDILASNPQLGRVEAGLKAADAEVRVAKAGHLPKVGLFADLNLLGNAYDTGLMTPENKTAWAVGVGVEIPLFQGFRVVKEVEAATAARRQLVQQQNALRDGLGFEARRTAIAIDKARRQIESAGAAYRAASENRDLHVRAYQDELVETKDVIEAQLMEALLAGQLYKIQFDLAESRAKLDLLTGTAAGR